MRRSNGIAARALPVFLASFAVLVAAGGAVHATENPAASPFRLEKVSPQQVCMTNDRYFAKDQLAIAVEGRTYYGCCEGCKARLAEDPAVRTANDPVTGKPVDKSTALIAALPDGRVFYFEGEDSYGKFRQQYGFDVPASTPEGQKATAAPEAAPQVR